MFESMVDIKINDIFEEMIEENFKINECLNVLIKFKTFVDLICVKLKTNLESNILELFEDFNKEVEDVFKNNKKDFSVNKNTTKSKTQLIEFLSSKPQTIDSNDTTSSQSSYQSIDSTELRPQKPKPKSKKQLITKEEDIEIDGNERLICKFIGCGKRLKTIACLRKHLSAVHSTEGKPYRCDVEGCTYRTTTKVMLNNHIMAHKGIKPFNCEFCQKQFSTEKYLKQHIDCTHKLTDEVLICELEDCYKRFKTELSLKNHQRFHIKEKRFVCEEPNCSYKTIIPSLLRQHKYVVHGKERPFVCHINGCPKSYKRNDELNKHIESHSSERNYKCQFSGCGKAFKTECFLKRHRIIHSDIELQCDWPGCEYTAKKASSLRSHYLIHSCERNFICNWPECDKRFKDKTHLETHQRIHTSDKRFACNWPGCHYRCTDYGNLYKHRRVHSKN